MKNYMQVNNEHSDKIFRQKADETAADISSMDSHWKQMQHLLVPSATTTIATKQAGASIKRIYLFFLAAATVAAIVLIFWFSKNTGGKNESNVALNKPVVYSIKNTGKVQDSAAMQVVVTAVPYTYISSSSVRQKKTSINPLPVYTVTDSIPESDLIPQQISKGEPAKNLMLDFYNKIEKKAQEFTIIAEVGGKLTCKEGTVITIPQLVFTDEKGNIVSGKITILVEEYYKYSDIVAANLTTMSDGKQLVTGGMIKLTAMQDGKPVNVQPGKAIDLLMPANGYDPEMSLFTAVSEINKLPQEESKNYSYSYPGNRNINWNLSAWQSFSAGFDNRIEVMNMQDEPDHVKGKDGRVGVFKIPGSSPYTREEAKEILTKKYGDYYRRIKVKKVREHRSIFDLFGPKDYSWTVKFLVGDSVSKTVDEALRGGYIELKDSAFYAAKVRQNYVDYMLSLTPAWRRLKTRNRYVNATDSAAVDSLTKMYNKQQKIKVSYSFQVKQMGWINCDRFYTYPSKTDFVINLPHGTNAANFVSQLVFTDIRSVMPGQTYENKIGFLNVPKGMNVYLVGLGERDGKVVSFMEKLKVGAAEVNIKELTETTPEKFRNKIAALDL